MFSVVLQFHLFPIQNCSMKFDQLVRQILGRLQLLAYHPTQTLSVCCNICCHLLDVVVLLLWPSLYPVSTFRVCPECDLVLCPFLFQVLLVFSYVIFVKFYPIESTFPSRYNILDFCEDFLILLVWLHLCLDIPCVSFHNAVQYVFHLC